MALTRTFLLAVFFASSASAQFSAAPPRLGYERIFGGSNFDRPTGIATDLLGNVIVTGITQSIDFPTTPGAFQTTLPGPLQISRDGGNSFSSFHFASAERADSLAFSADGRIGYAEFSDSFFQHLSLYRTADGGESWTAANNKLSGPLAFLTIDPSNPSTLYTATQGRLLKSTDAGSTFIQLNLPPAKDGRAPRSIAVDPSDPATLFVVIGNSTGLAYRTQDGGLSWKQLYFAPYYDPESIVIDPKDSNVVYCTGSYMNVFRSTDRGETFTQLLPGVSPNFMSARLAVDTSSVLYAATSNAIRISKDKGQTYTEIPIPGGGYLSNFQIDPLDPSHFAAVTSFDGGSQISQSRDAGLTWTSAPARSINISAFTLRGATLAVTAQNSQQVFITKWDPGQGRILWSTYLGPAQIDTDPKIAVDRFGDIYVSGTASTAGFPVTPGSLADTPGPLASRSGFVSKLATDGSRLLWSTLVPVTSISNLQVDQNGATYVVGKSCSSSFPQNVLSAPGSSGTFPQYSSPCNSTLGGGFIAKLNPTGTTLIYAALLEGTDHAEALTLDPDGNAYVVGRATRQSGASPNALQQQGGAFLMKVSPAGDRILYATQLGNFNTSVSDIARTPAGALYLTGAANGFPLPLSENAYQPLPIRSSCRYQGSDEDAFVLGLTPELQVSVLTFLGGTCIDGGRSIRLDRNGNIWLSGYAFPGLFPQQSAYQSSGNGFVAEFNPDASKLLFASYTDYAPQLALGFNSIVYLASSSDRFGPLSKEFLSSTSGGAALLTRIDPAP